MPELSGFELARQAKLMRPTLLRKPVRAVDLLNMIECKMVEGAATGHAPESSCENRSFASFSGVIAGLGVEQRARPAAAP